MCIHSLKAIKLGEFNCPLNYLRWICKKLLVEGNSRGNWKDGSNLTPMDHFGNLSPAMVDGNLRQCGRKLGDGIFKTYRVNSEHYQCVG